MAINLLWFRSMREEEEVEGDGNTRQSDVEA